MGPTNSPSPALMPRPADPLSTRGADRRRKNSQALESDSPERVARGWLVPCMLRGAGQDAPGECAGRGNGSGGASFGIALLSAHELSGQRHRGGWACSWLPRSVGTGVLKELVSLLPAGDLRYPARRYWTKPFDQNPLGRSVVNERLWLEPVEATVEWFAPADGEDALWLWLSSCFW